MGSKDCWLDDRRLTLVVGHGGSGKTEFAVNLALALADSGHPTTLADLDVVNPYFRSRERLALLQERGIPLIATSQACVDADLPVMPPELNGLIQTTDRFGVLDIGGGSSGARVLARYRPMLAVQSHRVWLVVNANRPQTRTADEVTALIADIQRTTGLSVAGLVNNTHLCGETTAEDVLTGAGLTDEVSRITGLPVVCHVVRSDLADQVSHLSSPLLPIEIRMKKPWEME